MAELDVAPVTRRVHIVCRGRIALSVDDTDGDRGRLYVLRGAVERASVKMRASCRTCGPVNR